MRENLENPIYSLWAVRNDLDLPVRSGGGARHLMTEEELNKERSDRENNFIKKGTEEERVGKEQTKGGRLKMG